MTELGYGLIACGRISSSHLDAIACGLLRIRIGERAGAEVAVYADYRELLADPAVDVVVVMVPTQMHPQVTVAALEAGKHVYC